MTRAAITPGTQPTRVNIVVMTIEPQPLSITANGGKMMHTKTRQQLIDFLSFFNLFSILGDKYSRYCYVVPYIICDAAKLGPTSRGLYAKYLLTSHRLRAIKTIKTKTRGRLLTRTFVLIIMGAGNELCYSGSD